mmetsp:Transcript_15267/g.44143  ORF Transcript_15267/g.44143 Transcript_15267/m.44143 type:complete len:205 (-) Transcript_15267:144-758(-)
MKIERDVHSRLHPLRPRHRVVVKLHSKATARYGQDRATVEVLREHVRVQGRRGHEYSQLTLAVGDSALRQREEHIRVQASLVGLVEDHDIVAAQVRIAKTFSQQAAIGHVSEPRARRRAVLKSDCVANVFAKSSASLLRHTPSHRNSCDSARLRDRDAQLLPATGQVEQARESCGVQEVLRNLSCLAAAGLAHNNDHPVLDERI